MFVRFSFVVRQTFFSCRPASKFEQSKSRSSDTAAATAAATTVDAHAADAGLMASCGIVSESLLEHRM